MLDRFVLASCICIGVALVIYFFYWNRFLSLVIGQILRILYRNKEGSSIWIDIGSVHLSLLAGRILLKDVRYHSANQTVKVLKGQIQWRYWIRRPTTEEEMGCPVGEDPKPPFRPLSCRIQLSLHGFEWFLYSRTAAYDNIISQMETANLNQSVSSSTDQRKSMSNSSHIDSTRPTYPNSSVESLLRVPLIMRNALRWFKGQLPNLDPMDLFPVGIEGTKGVIILGNHSTPCLLVSEFQRAEGTYGYTQAKSKHDLYKQLLTFRFQRVTISYVENEHYVDPMTTIGQLTHDCILQYAPPGQNLHHRSFIKLWRQLKLFAFTDRYMSSQRGLWAQKAIFSRGHRRTNKVSDESTPVGADFAHLEYAMESQLIEAPVIEVSYYCDAVGQVPPDTDRPNTNAQDRFDVGNGDTDPEWGIDAVVHRGFIKYGPWADRQRAELQKVFFPPSWRNANITPPLKPGQQRYWTAMHILVELRDNTTLQIPFREVSKDWQWDGKCDFPDRPRKREPATMQVTAGDCSSIRYTVPMVVDRDGYESTLEVHLDAITVTSSLNDIRLIQAETCRVRCEMPSPLQWNSERTWNISLTLRDPVLYLIRDHINMFTDLGRDWSSGPPHDYRRFIPIVYAIHLNLHRYNLNLYLNDNNIIDKPLIKEENGVASAFIEILTIPSNIFRPTYTTIPFTIEAPDASFSLSLPQWNTNALHAPENGNSLGKARFIQLDGSYLYYSSVREDLVEQLSLKFTVRDIVYKALGWSIRYFMVLKDNYFGSFTHFSILCEYLAKREKGLPPGDPIMFKYRPGKANMMQVTISMSANPASIIIPAGLPGYEFMSDADESGNPRIGACLVLLIPDLQMHLRLHDHFMEMSLNTDTLSGHIDLNYPENLGTSRRKCDRTGDLLLIDGIDITAHRLFGPQPRAATYVCIWEIQLGQVRTIISASDARVLVAAGSAFRINFVDMVNAPSSEFLPRVEPDVTFYKISVRAFDATWKTDRAALSVLMTQGLKIDTNDLGSQFHQKLNSVRIPSITTRVLTSGKQERLPWLEAAAFESNVFLDVYMGPRRHKEHTRDQVSFILDQDRLTGRAKRMFGNYLRSQSYLSDEKTHMGGVFLPQPAVPNTGCGTQSDQERRSRKAPYASHSLHHANMLDFSDSDGETGISEAERDARLAKSRSAPPVPHVIVEEENMTSGDESDDADLTDGSSSDSGWSNADSSDAPEPEDLLSMRYSRVCRHYRPRRDGQATIWEGSPYILVKDKRNLYSSGFAAQGATASTDETLPNVSRADNGCDVTTVRAEIRGKTELKLTPLLIPAIASLEEDMEKRLLGPDLSIDSLLIKQLGKFSKTKKPSSCINWVMNVSSAIVQVVQHISMADGSQPLISSDVKKLTIPSKLDNLVILEIHVEGFTCSGTTKERESISHCGLRSLSFNMGTSTDKLVVLPPSPGETSFTFTLADPKLLVGRGNVKLSMGSIGFSLGQRSPEFALATGLAIAQSVDQVLVVIKRWQRFADVTQRAMIYNILLSSKDIPAVEPLSTIQPSYLVQSGIPRDLRTDDKLRFLFHLRDCLWNLESPKRTSFRSIQVAEHVDQEVLRRELASRLSALDSDTRLASIEPLFFPSEGEILKGRRPYEACQTLSLSSGVIAVGIFHPSDTSASELVISNMQTMVCISSCDVFRNAALAVKNMSQTSFRSDKRTLVRKTLTSLILGDVTLTLLPHVMTFLQHLARLTTSQSITTPFRASAPKKPFRFINIGTTISLGHLHIQAAAENLVFEMGLGKVKFISSALYKSQEHHDRSMNNTFLFGTMYVRARSPQTVQIGGHDILAAFETAAGRLNVVSRQELRSRRKVRLVFSFEGLQVNVPRSALRLYRFVEEWRDDYLPGLESTLHSLVSEIKGTQKALASTTTRSPQQQTVIQIQGKVGHLGIALQVMHGTWLSWDVHDITGYLVSANIINPSALYTFGLQISSMALSVSAKSAMQVKMALPPFTITGRYDGISIHVLALVDFIDLKIKPSHWDKLLVVQQKFGQDINDLLSLMQETRHRHSEATTHLPARREKRLKYGGFLKMRGFRIGLEGAVSTVYLECQDVGSGLDSAAGNAWHITMSNLALSLAPQSAASQRGSGFNRRHRSAFVIIDFMVSTETRSSETSLSVEKRLRISVTKIHAVMQASSVNEVIDFVNELQVEVLGRKEQRSLELAAFKEKTRNILKTFEIRVRDVRSDEVPSWLDSCVIDITVQHVGVAFPLTHDHDLEMPELRVHDTAAIRAFLFSIAKIDFGSHRGETGQVTMTNLSFQFVPRFRQSVSGDFLGENHQTQNRLLYPEMKAQFHSTRCPSARRVWMGAIVSGFILDLDSTIPDYISSSIDVYHRGRESVERLSATVPRTSSITSQAAVHSEKHTTPISTPSIFASFRFSSGKVRLYSRHASEMIKSLASASWLRDVSDEQLLRLQVEIFNLPEVSVWAEFRATTFCSEPSTLVFKSTIHSSENTLRPTLLQYIAEVVNSVESRLRRVSHMQSSRPLPTIPKAPSSSVLSPAPVVSESTMGLRISFSLRIDQSRLELSCLPDVNVMAGLYWESGGFVLNVFPGAQRVTFTGTVGGLTIGLKHGFLSEDCVKLNARNLAFSVSFARLNNPPSPAISYVSVVLDTEFLGGVRFSRLQDVLCFKAVWLDNIPILNSQLSSSNKLVESTNISGGGKQSLQTWTTVILLQIRRIRADVDLGQSISTVTLDLSGAILRTKLSDSLNELSIFVQEVMLRAKGNVAGRMQVQNCVFQTTRRLGDSYVSQGRMLEIRMTSGPLSIDLQSEHQELLRYRAEPLAIEIYDDWSDMRSHRQDDESLKLAFTVSSPEVLAVVTVGTIPKLMTYANKFKLNLSVQRDGASRESAAFNRTRSLTVDNPLSTVAEAMLRTARTRLRQAESTLSYIIRQHMSFRLDHLQLVVFPRTMEDTELASFIGENVRARLDRLVASVDSPAKRDLRLSFSSMGISRYAQLLHSPTSVEPTLETHAWLMALLDGALEATIVGLPAMRMHMISEEVKANRLVTLTYDFNSEFVRREGIKEGPEDIYITLNVSLYSWLTILRKNLTRDMEQVRNISDRQPPPKTGSVATKAPWKVADTKEPLPSTTVEHQSKGIAPALSSQPPSIFGDTTAVESPVIILTSERPALGTPDTPGPLPFPSTEKEITDTPDVSTKASNISSDIVYVHRTRHIERLKMRQLGEATPDVMHPFFMKKAGFNLEDSLPQYVHEYATIPLEEIMEVLLKLYSRQLANQKKD
ncbi:hypothetical protein AX17_004464 [Amanita inopinata Kibby_2008]|nr:hypothetical protein AX17_004464 [Amanita inopinata Kibby_2008]